MSSLALLLQTVALLCQVHGGDSRGLDYRRVKSDQGDCQIALIRCADSKKKSDMENLKQCILEGVSK